MTDQEKMQRVLRLMVLLSGNRRYTRAELSERTGITERTVFRYFETMKSVGLELEQTDGRYRLMSEHPTAKALGELFHFSEEEAHLLCLMLEQTEASTAVRERLLRKLHALYDMTVASQLAEERQVRFVQVLKEAMRRERQVCLLGYRSSNSRSIRDRVVEPFKFLQDYTGVWCFDVADKCNKQFLLSRMEQVEPRASSWQYSSLHHEPFTDAFRMSAPVAIATVEAELSMKAWNLLQEEFPLAAKYVQRKGTRYQMQLPVAAFQGIGRFVLGMPGEIAVEGPAAFKNWLREQAKKKFRLTEVDSEG